MNLAINLARTAEQCPDKDAGFDYEVLLADDTRIRPDTVIAATGYRRGLEPMVGHLGVLDIDGNPLMCGGRSIRMRPAYSSADTAANCQANSVSCDSTPGPSHA